MNIIQERLFLLSEEKNADFQAKLAPTIKRECCLGTRLPEVRKMAKEFQNTEQMYEFLHELPHKYHDENILHSIFLSHLKDYEECIKEVEAFLPYIDNWAVCDTLRPTVFKKHTAELFPFVKKWMKSSETYTCRFGVDCLMSYYLDDKFESSQHELVAEIQSEEYYVNMMNAWYFATALAKQWAETIPYIEEKRLPVWVHNKTIQKAIESFRITSEQKDYLRSMRIKSSSLRKG